MNISSKLLLTTLPIGTSLGTLGAAVLYCVLDPWFCLFFLKPRLQIH